MTSFRPVGWHLLVLSAVPLVFMHRVGHPIVVVGHSMEPTLQSGQMAWVDRTYYHRRSPRRGDVLIFRRGSEICVKRVYRAPGDTLWYFATEGGQCLLVREMLVSALLRGRH